MHDDKISSFLNDDDPVLFNLSEADKKTPFFDLDHFVHELTPQYSYITEKMLRGEDVDTKDVQKIIHDFVDTLVPFYNRDGSIDDPKMARLHETLVAVGRQL